MATRGTNKEEWLGPKQAAGGIAARALEQGGDAVILGFEIMSLGIKVSPEQVQKRLAELAEKRKFGT